MNIKMPPQDSEPFPQTESPQMLNHYGSPDELLPQIEARLQAGIPCRVLVTGMSMFPFLTNRRDSVILTAFDGNASRGDILFYRRSPQCVLHRVYGVNADGSFRITGDAQQLFEKVMSDQVVGKAVSVVRRDGRVVDCTAFGWRLVSAVWMSLIGIRPFLLKVIYLLVRIRHKLGRKEQA